MTNRFTLQIGLLVAVSCLFTSAWMPPTTSRTTRRLLTKDRSFASQCIHLNLRANEDGPTEDTEDDETKNSDATANVEWGVSYIGGDPCGSKYNTDPFDKNPSEKPGMPDDMKARIEALAQKKLREESQ